MVCKDTDKKPNSPINSNKHKFKLALVLGVIALVGTVVFFVLTSNFIAVDNCLDAGGSFDYALETCVH
ncbi:hypothetical protein PPE03_14220 [Pseudoalteromonas peptidolytica]|nr:hypothetical protein [Pseudoalteromonas peptidolytica]GEK09173.1 hypothetical protein PPE03_14220 [Pseudoalteromonas peptidolytica]